jgi:hypothetical protein
MSYIDHRCFQCGNYKLVHNDGADGCIFDNCICPVITRTFGPAQIVPTYIDGSTSAVPTVTAPGEPSIYTGVNTCDDAECQAAYADWLMGQPTQDSSGDSGLGLPT